jgi:rfaE bifunctional protein kinase chain/domain
MSKDLTPDSKKNVFVLGDVMLDKYLQGVVNRISPEAPVPILDVLSSSEQPGGAANVALNLSGLKINTLLFSVLGEDEAAESVEAYLKKIGLSTEGLIKSPCRKTSEKMRIMSQGQHVLRLDKEDIHPISDELEKALFQKVQILWDKYQPGLLVLQDYNKGVLTPTLIRELLSLAKEKSVPVAVDPKEENFWEYQGATIFKPNRREIQKKLPFTFDNNPQDLKKVSDYIFDKLNGQIVVITLGEKGLWIANRSSHFWIKNIKLEIVDVCGAGDSVISSLVYALMNHFDLETMGKLANAAGAQVCSRSGVVALDWNSFWTFYHNTYSK